MLDSPVIDIRGIYTDYHKFAKSVTDSVINGNSGYLKPGVLKTINSYKKPYQMQSVRAALIWNAFYPKSYIGQSTTFKILEFNQSMIPHSLRTTSQKDADNKFIMEDNPEFSEFLYDNFDEDAADRVIALFNERPELKHYGLTQVAIPLDVEMIPTEFLEYADVGSITNAVLSKGNILLESLGFVVVKSRKRQMVSNIIRI